MGNDAGRTTEARIPQWIASGLVALVVAATVGSFTLIRDLDRSVMSHDIRIGAVESRQVDLRAQLRCEPGVDAHQICTRLSRLEHALEKYHKE